MTPGCNSITQITGIILRSMVECLCAISLHRRPGNQSYSAMARWAVIALLCLSAQFASYDAWASMPGGERLIQGCVLEGMLLGPTGGSLSLPYRDQVDWTKFEGQMVRFKKRYGRGIDVLLVPPSAIGPCDAALVAAALPRALAQRADHESVHEKNYEKGLADVERAIKLLPQNCDFVATHVFILERLGRAQRSQCGGCACRPYDLLATLSRASPLVASRHRGATLLADATGAKARHAPSL